jgi:hypothetical protein
VDEKELSEDSSPFHTNELYKHLPTNGRHPSISIQTWFWQEFNLYTTSVISSQIEAKREVKVDFKMSTLKPKLCSWLYSVWQHLTYKLLMVVKGWNKTGLLRAFDLNFQKQAMVDNIKTPLFKTIEKKLEIETSNHGEDETDAEVSLDTVLEESLSRVVELPSSISSTSMAALRNVARRNRSDQR